MDGHFYSPLPEGYFLCPTLQRSKWVCLYTEVPFFWGSVIKRIHGQQGAREEVTGWDSWLSRGGAKPGDTVGMVLCKNLTQRSPLQVKFPFQWGLLFCTPDVWQNTTSPKGCNTACPSSLLVFEDGLSLRKEHCLQAQHMGWKEYS